MIRGVCGHVWEAKSMSSVILELNLDKHEEIFGLPGQHHSSLLTEAPIVARVSVSSPSLDEMPSAIEIWQTRGTDERSMAERFRILSRVDVFHNTFTVVLLLHRHYSHLIVGLTGNVRKALPTMPCKHNVIVCVEPRNWPIRELGTLYVHEKPRNWPIRELGTLYVHEKPALSNGHGGEPTLHPHANRSIPSSEEFSPPIGAARSGSLTAAAPSYPQPQNVVLASSPPRFDSVVDGPARPPHRTEDESIFYYHPGNTQRALAAAAAAAGGGGGGGVPQQLEPIYPPRAVQAMKAARFYHRGPSPSVASTLSATADSRVHGAPATPSQFSAPQHVQAVPVGNSNVFPPAVAPSQQQQYYHSAAAVQMPPKPQEDIQALHLRRFDTSSRHVQQLQREAAATGTELDALSFSPPHDRGKFLSPSVPFELQFRLPGDSIAKQNQLTSSNNNNNNSASRNSAATPSRPKTLILREEQTQTSSAEWRQPVIPAPDLQFLNLQQQMLQQQAKSNRAPSHPPPPPAFEEFGGRSASPFSQGLSVQELLSVVCHRMKGWTEEVEDSCLLFMAKKQRLLQASAAAIAPSAGTVQQQQRLLQQQQLPVGRRIAL